MYATSTEIHIAEEQKVIDTPSGEATIFALYYPLNYYDWIETML